MAGGDITADHVNCVVRLNDRFPAIVCAKNTKLVKKSAIKHPNVKPIIKHIGNHQKEK